MSLKWRAQDTLERARRASIVFGHWPNFDNFVFNPNGGLIARCFPDIGERVAFRRTEQYLAVCGVIKDN